ncbi:MAG TPA: SDR family oxidoreductase [Vicinamibacterales bacterium]
MPLTLITGSTSGLGEALALELSATHDLLLHGRDDAKLQHLLARCVDPERHRCWLADLSDAAAAGESLRRAGIEVANFVHCAGVNAIEPIHSATPQQVVAMFQVNVLSALAIIAACRETLRSIVLISSAASLRGEKGVAVYSATKGAIDAMARSLAVELAPRTRVNVVNPGIVRTPMSAPAIDSIAFAEGAERKYILGIGETHDVTAITGLLLSHRAEWITGSSVTVDGGRTLF